MASKFAIGQRVRVRRLGCWNGTPPDTAVRIISWRAEGVVTGYYLDTITVDMGLPLGRLQFLPDELAVLDNTSGDSVE